MTLPSDRKLTTDELRAWLDRKPSPRETVAPEPAQGHAAATDNEPLVCLVHGTERCAHDQEPDHRDWVEFELARIGRELLEAGHG